MEKIEIPNTSENDELEIKKLLEDHLNGIVKKIERKGAVMPGREIYHAQVVIQDPPSLQMHKVHVTKTSIIYKGLLRTELAGAAMEAIRIVEKNREEMKDL
jgi:hypothetical protein